MILHQNATFIAQMQRGALVVTDRSPDLPGYSPARRPTLIDYLNRMAIGTPEHWQVARMSFEGIILTVTMERCEPGSKLVPHYLVQVLSLAPPVMEMDQWSLVDGQKSLVNQFRSSALADGWREMATSKPITDLIGAFTIASIWMKY